MVNIYANVTWFCHPLQIGRVTWRLDYHDHFPNTQPEAIFSRNVHIIWSGNNQGRGIVKTQPVRSSRQIKQRAFARSEIVFNRVLFKKDNGLGLASCTFQGQIFNIRLAITLRRRTLFDDSFELADHVKVKNVCYGRGIRCTMLYFKLNALLLWSTQNSQVPLKQFKKRKSTGFNQMQGLSILTNFRKPKLTVGTIMIL